MKNFRKQFPVLNQYTYLNTAASGLLPEAVMEWRQDHDLDLLISGSILKEKQGEVLTGVREAVGRFFNCAPNRVALTPNFSYGFNTLMEGVEKGKKVMLLKNDYPSVNWAVESRDFETCYAEIDENLEQNILEVAERVQPDIFAFSLVQWINGIKIDLDFLKELKQNFPDLLLFGDGTQYCGTENFDFEDSALDVLGASTYKWMNAGYGNAFFLFKQHMEDKISPRSLGFNSLQGKYKAHEGSLIGKFEPGHQDTLNFGSLKVAIELIEKTGIENIEKQVNFLASEAKKAFEKKGLLEPSVVKRDLHSSIFNIRGDEAVFRKLRSNNILCSQRGEGIRVSFHYFNSEDDLEKLLKALK
ncbi:Selenocysteine lyase/Cysteine desulfurase [Salinimicrobium catena]|uniref:Selenocysteine lyase/Cysteine desulfurase n=1 Tax=Salinimicrobium catena TaxID=390640 RepID=A0A1H5P6E6_9FLAO|nr:aminotransferase class V-fold PLP-dependent enzyme [Salinimicrobium catena]SDL71308.1 Selenocysteine lyase/Cysteine desulfurase [Salinimicrobium catena]SEF09260.1 Selenocysteine lyase/Cysteine desulfurase [Salinimicrobium catena]